MDQFDRATELEEQHREIALASAKRNHPAGQSYSHCEDCGDEIPVARRQAVPGCHRCIHCQEDRERGRG